MGITGLENLMPDQDEECTQEVHSWVHFAPEQIDSYWIRCDLLGPHAKHFNSHTGLTWESDN